MRGGDILIKKRKIRGAGGGMAMADGGQSFDPAAGPGPKTWPERTVR